jgi:multidrug efflux pump subunit AcrA (membrane-fusion protein)
MRQLSPSHARVYAFGTCALLSVIVATTGCAHNAAGKHGRTRASAPPVPIARTTAQPGTVRPTVTLAGIIAPYQNVAITASQSEPTLKVNVNEGDSVHVGEVLAVQDVSDLQANLASQLSTAQSDEARIAQARYTADLNYGQNPDAVRQARAALVQANQTLVQARSDLARYKGLVSSGYISDQQYVQQETTVANDVAAVRSAQAALSSQQTNNTVNGTSPQSGLQAANIAAAVSEAASARSQADQIRTQIARATIYSPVDGVVVNRNLNVGEYPSGRTIFTLQELDKVYGELNASSADVFSIRNGASVTVTAGDDRSGQTYSGSVVGVLGQVEPGSTNFTVKTLLANPNDRLKAGVPVTAVIELPAVSGISVPSTAFLDDSHTSLMLDRDGQAAVVHVKELATAGGKSIVSGVAAGDSVIANGQLGITQGQKLSER